MTGILAGLRVVEGSAFIAAPLGGMTLAQLGADVIRFDDINGGLDSDRWPVTKDGRSIYWAGLNKGKRSIAVDLRNPRAQELLGALITGPGPDAGVFLTNLPARGWCGYDALAAKRADLIMVLIQGNHDGTTAVDYTVNCATGLPFATGPIGTEGPVNHLLPAWDMIAGSHAAIAVLAAERHRTRAGVGQRLCDIGAEGGGQARRGLATQEVGGGGVPALQHAHGVLERHRGYGAGRGDDPRDRGEARRRRPSIRRPCRRAQARRKLRYTARGSTHPSACGVDHHMSSRSQPHPHAVAAPAA